VKGYRYCGGGVPLDPNSPPPPPNMGMLVGCVKIEPLKKPDNKNKLMTSSILTFKKKGGKCQKSVEIKKTLKLFFNILFKK
jgi:hypothetical protein